MQIIEINGFHTKPRQRLCCTRFHVVCVGLKAPALCKPELCGEEDLVPLPCTLKPSGMSTE